MQMHTGLHTGCAHSGHSPIHHNTHLSQGMFYRTARMLEAGIRPVFVFDGKPPEIKRLQLEQRVEK